MATPEIHIHVSLERKSKKNGKSGERPNTDGKPLKRQRVDVRRGKKEKGNDTGEGQAPASKRDLLSTNTQSFRHLFSFGANQTAGVGGTETVSGDRKEGESGREAKVEKSPSVEPAIRFSIFDDEEDVTVKTAESPSGIADSLTTSHGDSKGLLFSEPAQGEFLIHNGLAHDSPADVRAIAVGFNGSCSSVAKLQSEWLDGGKKDELREDLRLKRYKRMRGRVLGKSASNSGR